MSFGRMRNRRKEPRGVQAFGGRVGGTPSAARLVDPFTMFVKSTASPDSGPAGQKQNILDMGMLP